MKNTERFLRDVYRFCDSPEEINWNARRVIDIPYHKDVILPSMYRFLEKAIKQTTFRRTRKINGLVGLSGGLDSVVVSYATANSMQQSIEAERTSEANLALISFTGLEDNDTQAIARDLDKRFPLVNIRYEEVDIGCRIQGVVDSVRGLVKKLEGPEIETPGEVITRLICSILNETGDRTGYASIDTTNGTEFILGEFSVGLGYDLSLLSDLYKSSVFALGRLLNVPRAVLDANPVNSAYNFTTKPELYFGEVPENVTARHVFEVLDPVLHWLHEKRKTPREIAEALGHSEDFVKRVNRRMKNQKHRQESPKFCIESHEINLPNRTPLLDEDAKNLADKEMLKERFR